MQLTVKWTGDENNKNHQLAFYVQCSSITIQSLFIQTLLNFVWKFGNTVENFWFSSPALEKDDKYILCYRLKKSMEFVQTVTSLKYLKGQYPGRLPKGPFLNFGIILPNAFKIYK